MVERRTQILDVPGAGLRYEIHEGETESTALALLMIVHDGERARAERSPLAFVPSNAGPCRLRSPVA